MKNFIADLKFLINPGSSIVRSFKEEFSWIKKTALKQHFYTYHGSLTTSPYSECVIWIIFTKPIDISRNQVIKNCLINNNLITIKLFWNTCFYFTAIKIQKVIF